MNKQCLKLFTTLSLLLCTIYSVQAQQLIVKNAYIRATIPGTNVSSAYMVLQNKTDSAITLTGVTGDFSDRIEIHEHVMTDSMMSMRQRETLVINAQSEVELQPYGYHLMIFNIVKPLIANEKAMVTLQFSQGQPQTIELPITSIKQNIKKNTQSKSNHQHHHH